MWKFVALVLAGVSLVPATGAAVEGGTREPAAMQLEGKLEYDDGMGPHIPEAGVWVGPFMVVKGDWYGLDFGKNKELADRARRLPGKRVRATGTLTMRDLPGGLKGFGGPVRVLVVEKLEAAAGKEDSARVEALGKLEARAQFGYPAAREAPALTAGGLTYVLDFGTNEALRQQALKLDGKTVRLRGTLEGWESFTIMCVPEPERIPVIRVTAVKDDGNKC
jgi:hypothetical protein